MEEINKAEETIEKREKRIISFLGKKKEYLIYLALAFLVWLGYYIRTRNVASLVDVTTGKYIPADPDALAFLRYATYLFENGHFMIADTLRYYPLGFTWLEEFKLLSYFIVYLYKFLHIFNSAVTFEFADVIYPAVAFSIALVFFFLLVRKLFDYKIALLSSLFLIVVPAFLFRTLSGISDKEALGVVFMFAAFYFYVVSWRSKTLIRGLIFGMLAALTSSFFTVFNGLLVRRIPSPVIAIYELTGGFIALSIYLLFTGEFKPEFFIITPAAWGWLGILSILGTAFPFISSVNLMKKISPYTVTLTVNLEVVYGIIIAYVLWKQDEAMTLGFYIGTLIILATIFGNGLLKQYLKKDVE